MAINVQIIKKNNESNSSIIKKFTRKVQESGVISRAKSLRYETRQPSKYTKKKAKLSNLIKKQANDKLVKLGKKAPSTHGRR